MNILLKNIKKPGYKGDITGYLNNGGYEAIKKALKLSPGSIIEELETAQLLGRGGAAFPVELKWDFGYKAQDFPKYVVCNADEGEPGTFKDKILLENDPHLLIEGMLLCGYTINAVEGFIYLRGEYHKPYAILLNALGRLNTAIFWERISWEPIFLSGLLSTAERVPTSAVRRQHCWIPLPVKRDNRG